MAILETRDRKTEYGTVPASGGAMMTTSDSPLYRFRRRELYLLADAFRVEYPHDAPATEMRILLMSQGIDGKTPPPNPVEAKPRGDVVEETPIEEMDFQELRRECKRRSISFVRTDNKHTLLKKLAPPEVLYGQIAS